MLIRIALALVCALPLTFAHAADVKMGSVTLKLPPPSGYCELDPKQKRDREVLNDLKAAQGKTVVLAPSAECKELSEYRAGRLTTLDHPSHYQILASLRSTPANVSDAKAECQVMAKEGEQALKEGIDAEKKQAAKARDPMTVDQDKFLGVVAEDPVGCYYVIVLKATQNGKTESTINAAFMGSIKGRLLIFTLYVPYATDASIQPAVDLVKAHMATVKTANGM